MRLSCVVTPEEASITSRQMSARRMDRSDRISLLDSFSITGGDVVSVGTYTAEQLANDEVQFRGVNSYELLWVTVEPDTGSETPSSTALVEMPLE